jgi:hypothetical protein
LQRKLAFLKREEELKAEAERARREKERLEEEMERLKRMSILKDIHDRPTKIILKKRMLKAAGKLK